MTDSAELVEVQLSTSLPLPWAQALFEVAQQLGACESLAELRLPIDTEGTPEQQRALIECMQHLADELHQQGVRRF